MIPGYCTNTVRFSGNNESQALEYFNSIEEHSPPFLAIMVYDNALHFDSRWVPPIRSLNEIAEQFDVSYEIEYRVPYEDKGVYRYTSLQQEILSGAANAVRDIINHSADTEELEDAEAILTRHMLAQSLNLHELEVLSYLTGKKYNEFRLKAIQDRAEDNERDRPWESDHPDPGPRFGR